MDATERHYAHAAWTARRDLIQTLADRPLTDAERAHVLQSARGYVANATRYRSQGL